MIVKFDSEKDGLVKTLKQTVSHFKVAKDFIDQANSRTTKAKKEDLLTDFDFSNAGTALLDYATAVDSAQWSLQGFIKYSLSAKNASSLLSKALVGVAGSAKKLLSVFINAAIWFVVEKAIEGIVSLIQNAIKSQAKLDEAAQKAAENIDNTKASLSDAKD